MEPVAAPSGPQRGGRPDRTERTERTERPDRPDRPERSDEPGGRSKPEQPAGNGRSKGSEPRDRTTDRASTT